MKNPDINTIKAMPQEELEALNRKLYGKLAAQVVGMIFLKLSVAGVSRVLAQKAIIVAAKRL